MLRRRALYRSSSLFLERLGLGYPVLVVDVVVVEKILFCSIVLRRVLLRYDLESQKGKTCAANRRYTCIVQVVFLS